MRPSKKIKFGWFWFYINFFPHWRFSSIVFSKQNKMALLYYGIVLTNTSCQMGQRFKLITTTKARKKTRNVTFFLPFRFEVLLKRRMCFVWFEKVMGRYRRTMSFSLFRIPWVGQILCASSAIGSILHWSCTPQCHGGIYTTLTILTNHWKLMIMKTSSRNLFSYKETAGISFFGRLWNGSCADCPHYYSKSTTQFYYDMFNMMLHQSTTCLSYSMVASIY